MHLFIILLKVHNIVVTDEEQTSDGKGFWIDMILWALVKDMVFMLQMALK